MKTIYSFLSYLGLMLLVLTGCEDKYNHPSEEEIPLAKDINCIIAIDQSTNEVTFKLDNPKCNPVWIFGEKDYSTVNGLTRIFAVAGTYQVEVKISNSNGVSDGSVIKEFTIDNTIVDFTRYFKTFAGDATKDWIIAREEPAHLGCGEPGSDGTGWWSAIPNEKEQFGVYENIMTFSLDKQYTHNPGASGTVYVNVGCSAFPEYNTSDEDFVAPVDVKTVDYDFTVEGNDVYLVLPPKSYLPYIPNDGVYNSPRFKIASMKNNRIELVADNGEIAWHYTLVTRAKELSREEMLAGNWFWAKDKAAHMGCGPSGSEGLEWWSAMPNEKEKFGLYNHTLSFTADGTYLFNPGETGSFYVNKDCTLFPEFNTSEEDFNVPVSEVNSTWQFVDEGADTYLVLPAQMILGYVPNDAAYNNPKFKILTLTESELKLVIDNGEIAWHYYFIKEGAGEGETDDPVAYDPDSEFNLWKTCNYEMAYFYAPDWNEVGTPEMTVDGKAYTIQLPVATFQQWQAQVKFITDIRTDAQTTYDFCVTLNSNVDLGKVTVKLVKDSDDDTFYFMEMVSVKAYEDKLISFAAMPGIEMDKVQLVFDFGGNPANTTLVISDVVLKDTTKD